MHVRFMSAATFKGSEYFCQSKMSEVILTRVPD